MEKVPADLLQRAVHKRSVSSEVYLAMRARFARSLATLTACMHILGIGDRHLDNFLLHTPTGNVVGIDFGHDAQFGLAVGQIHAVWQPRITLGRQQRRT